MSCLFASVSGFSTAQLTIGRWEDKAGVGAAGLSGCSTVKTVPPPGHSSDFHHGGLPGGLAGHPEWDGAPQMCPQQGRGSRTSHPRRSRGCGGGGEPSGTGRQAGTERLPLVPSEQYPLRGRARLPGARGLPCFSPCLACGDASWLLRRPGRQAGALNEITPRGPFQSAILWGLQLCSDSRQSAPFV